MVLRLKIARLKQLGLALTLVVVAAFAGSRVYLAISTTQIKYLFSTFTRSYSWESTPWIEEYTVYGLDGKGRKHELFTYGAPMYWNTSIVFSPDKQKAVFQEWEGLYVYELPTKRKTLLDKNHITFYGGWSFDSQYFAFAVELPEGNADPVFSKPEKREWRIVDVKTGKVEKLIALLPVTYFSWSPVSRRYLITEKLPYGGYSVYSGIFPEVPPGHLPLQVTNFGYELETLLFSYDEKLILNGRYSSQLVIKYSTGDIYPLFSFEGGEKFMAQGWFYNPRQPSDYRVLVTDLEKKSLYVVNVGEVPAGKSPKPKLLKDFSEDYKEIDFEGRGAGSSSYSLSFTPRGSLIFIVEEKGEKGDSLLELQGVLAENCRAFGVLASDLKMVSGFTTTSKVSIPKGIKKYIFSW